MSSSAMVPRRRRSFAGPIVLIIIGVVFLLGNIGVFTWNTLGRLFAHYWPVLIILWGVVKLVEYYQAQRDGVRPSGIGFGGVMLLIFLVLCGLAATKATKVNWDALHDEMDLGDNVFSPFSNSYNFTNEQSQALPEGASVRVVSDHGDVVINNWDEKKIRVVTQKKVSADNEDQGKKIDSETQPNISVAGNLVTINANTAAGGNHDVDSDLEIYLPKNVTVDVAAKHGEISVHTRAAEVKANSGHGDIQISDVDGNVSAVLHKGSLNASRIKGNLLLDGRLDDTTIADVSGTVTMTGDYFGDISLSKIAHTVNFKSSRTSMQFDGLDGDLTLESGDLRARSVTGPLTVMTHAKDIHIDDVTGAVKVENSDGDVEIHADRLPLGNIRIDNRKGDIQLVVPATSSFTLEARTHDGDIDSDFNQLNVQNSGGQTTATGSVGNAGSRLEIYNEYGKIEIRKAG